MTEISEKMGFGIFMPEHEDESPERWRMATAWKNG